MKKKHIKVGYLNSFVTMPLRAYNPFKNLYRATFLPMFLSGIREIN